MLRAAGPRRRGSRRHRASRWLPIHLAVAFALGIVAAAALPASGRAAAETPPFAVVAHYDDLDGLAQAVDDARMPSGEPVVFGDYLGSLHPTPNPYRLRAATRLMPNGRFAPLLEVRPNRFWLGREASALAGATDGLAGPLAGADPMLRMAPLERLAWGQEIGRRFRDRLRHDGVPSSTWQFDEVPSEVLGPLGARWRQFVRGILLGLWRGRPERGDRPARGFVWVSHNALSLAARRPRGDLASFWAIVNRTALALVGEEYPVFAGDPRRVARAQGAGQRLLAAGGGPRAALAQRYVVGMTPGYRLLPELGGNVHGWARPAVQRWRLAYVRARAATGVAGFAMYPFRFENSAQWVMDDAASALALGTRLVLAKGARGG